MTSLERLILSLEAGIVALWMIRHVALTIIYRGFDVLTRKSPKFQQSNPPLVSALIPAKDEEAIIADCLASVAKQDYSNLEILVIDDRSTDGTANIIREFAKSDPRVHLISIHNLPSGWTGKTHALHVGTSEARGEWFWYLDADTLHSPESLSVMLEYARLHNAAMASLVPEMRCESFWETIVQPLAGIVLMRSFPLSTVNRDDRKLAFANGQYILIRRDAYKASGGHEAVRDRFVEDIFMAKRVKALGMAVRVAITNEISSTRMYTSLPRIIQGWSRILYDASERKPWPLILKILEPLAFTHTGDVAIVVAPLLLLMNVAVPFAWWLLGLAALHQVLKATVLYRMYRWTSPRVASRAAFWYPLAGVVAIWICLKSIGMCLTGRVTWRGTAYGAPAAR